MYRKTILYKIAHVNILIRLNFHKIQFDILKCIQKRQVYHYNEKIYSFENNLND